MGAEQPPVSVAASFSVDEATIDTVLLAAVEQFEDYKPVGAAKSGRSGGRRTNIRLTNQRKNAV